MPEEREGKSTQAALRGYPAGSWRGAGGRRGTRCRSVKGKVGLQAERKTLATAGQGDPFPPEPTAGAGLGCAAGGDRQLILLVAVLQGTTDTGALAGSVWQALQLLWLCRGG